MTKSAPVKRIAKIRQMWPRQVFGRYGGRRLLLTSGWIVVLAHALGVLHMWFEGPFGITRRYMAVYFVMVAEAGLLCRWGPIVLFTLGGFCTTSYWQPYSHIASNYMEEVMQDVGIPAFAAIVGGIIGAIMETVGGEKRDRASTVDDSNV
jgi:hypothetical protein